MKTYIGLDLGTSSIKGLLVDEFGTILKEHSESYPIYFPKENYSEQDPKDWLKKCLVVLKLLLNDENKECLKGISFGGQMHGLVMLDDKDEIIRNAILWNDGRSTKETEYLNNVIGTKKLSEYTGNIAFPGFTAPKILWVYNNEPENFKRINKIMLSKDYLIYSLTGVFATDVSDASGMLLLDVKNRRYSKEMLDICHIKENNLPKLFESYEVVGNLKDSIKKELGLKHDVKVIAGAGDNAAAAIGTGTIGNKACNISLGTSGTIFFSNDNFSVDKNNALHSFCDASGNYHLMGCILSAASCRKWWLEDIIQDDDYLKDESNLRDSDVIFLPYLVGERSPHNDVNARGAFINLSATTSRGDMSKAVLEGVTFALKDCFEIAELSGVHPEFATICGGGARCKTWVQIVADTLDLPIHILKTNQGPSYGAAMIAMIGDGIYKDAFEACNKIVKTKEIITPNKNKMDYYSKKYEIFKKLYPALKELRK